MRAKSSSTSAELVRDLLHLAGDALVCFGMFAYSVANQLIVDQNEKHLARGLASFNSSEINKIKGKQSKELEKILGYMSKSEIIHKDDMVML